MRGRKKWFCIIGFNNVWIYLLMIPPIKRREREKVTIDRQFLHFRTKEKLIFFCSQVDTLGKEKFSGK